MDKTEFIKLISSDNVEFNIPKNCIFLERGIFNLIKENEYVPLNSKILEYIFFTGINVPKESIIQFLQIILPYSLEYHENDLLNRLKNEFSSFKIKENDINLIEIIENLDENITLEKFENFLKQISYPQKKILSRQDFDGILREIENSKLDQVLNFDISIGRLKTKKKENDFYECEIVISNTNYGFSETKGEMKLKFIEYYLTDVFKFLAKLENDKEIEKIINEINALPIGSEINFRIDFYSGFTDFRIKRIERTILAIETRIKSNNKENIIGIFGQGPEESVIKNIKKEFELYRKF